MEAKGRRPRGECDQLTVHEHVHVDGGLLPEAGRAAAVVAGVHHGDAGEEELAAHGVDDADAVAAGDAAAAADVEVHKLGGGGEGRGGQERN